MDRMRSIILAGAVVALASPAFASPCGDRIAALDTRLDTATRSGVAASSAGQGVAAARGGRASQDGAGPTVPFQETAREEDATRRNTQAGGGGSVAEARAALNRARTAEGRSDEAACMLEANEVERLLAAPR
jgi:hypothetical protein